MAAQMERKLLTYLSVIFVVLIVLILLVYRGVRTMTVSGEMAEHALRVQEELKELSSQISEAGELAREYFITADGNLLDAYSGAKKLLGTQTQSLETLTHGNPTQQSRVNEIRKLIEERLKLLDSMVLSRQREEFDVGARLFREARLAQSKDDLGKLIGDMEREEQRLYEERSRQEDANGHRAAAVALVGILIATALLAMTGLSVRREIHKQLKGEERLREAEEAKTLLLARAQEARAQAETANRMKDEFLAVVSHELRSPLNAMLGWARVLRSGDVDQQTHDHAVQVIEQSATVQSRLIEDLLDSARIASGKLRIEPRPVNLIQVVRSAIDTVQPEFEKKDVQLQTSFDSRVSTINGDAERLQQVVWNLLSNAVKFTPKGGRVWVELRREGLWTTLMVKDNGRGIKAEDLPYVFDRFRQSDSSNTRRAGGLGLGLSLVKNLVEMHGGKIAVESAGEGRGAAFTVNLPLAPTKTRASEILRENGELGVPLNFPQVLQGVNVLTVDDEAQARDLVATLLKKYGAVITEASSSAEAMEFLTQDEAEKKFDILVSDIGMPDENGYTLVRRLRQLPAPVGKIPAVALTGFDRVEDRINALEAGFQMHLAKPVEPAELMVVIAKLTGRSLEESR